MVISIVKWSPKKKIITKTIDMLLVFDYYHYYPIFNGCRYAKLNDMCSINAFIIAKLISFYIYILSKIICMDHCHSYWHSCKHL